MKLAKLKLSMIAIGLAANLVACTSTTHQESTGQYLDNTVITTKVKAKLANDPEIKSLPITVNSYKNTVQLSGFVDNRQQEARAVRLAREVEGVQAVEDNLIIKH